MKAIGLLATLLTAFVLLYATFDFPDWADPQAPASVHLSPHYLTESMNETAVPNIVTAVLADYRGYDTMFETTVVFTAGLVVYTLLRRTRRKLMPGDVVESPAEIPHQTIIVKTVCRYFVPFMQLYALYVIAHGHHSPGGGFQGGVILGASFILLAISHDIKIVLHRVTEKTNLILAALGVLLYSGIGVISLMFQKNFLDYSALSSILPATDKVMARSHGMLGVEIGVAIAVMASMILIYMNLSSDGTYEHGM